MPHDPALIAETNAWLAKAASDLRAAEHALKAQDALTTAHAMYQAVLACLTPDAYPLN